MPARVHIGNPRGGYLWLRGPLLLLLWLCFAVPVVAGIYALFVVREHGRDLPTEPRLDLFVRDTPASSVVLAADGSVLAILPFEEGDISGHRFLVEYEELPLTLIQAVLAAEDLRFFEHQGVDARAVLRSALTNLKAGRVVEGASTITQQLARNLVEDIGKERSLRRKIREALLARRIERHYDKKQILSAYLNTVFLGANAYGVKAAARKYFDKELHELDEGECALIAGLIQIPGRGNPYRAPEVARERRNEILDRMVRAGFVSEERGQALKEQALELRDPVDPYGKLAPWMSEEIRRRLGEMDPTLLQRGGLTVESTVEPALVMAGEELSREWASSRPPNKLQGKTRNQAHSKSDGAREDEGQPPELAAYFVDQHTGYVELMVGGTDWRASQFNRATQGCRQPGSAFKAFIYGAALERQEITPGTPLRDGPISEYDPELGVFWKPQNSGREFRGLALAHQALASSLNTPAVDVFDRVGVDAVIEFAQRLGVRSPLHPSRPLALGASCLRPSELVGAYAVIARRGDALEPLLIKRIHHRHRALPDRAAYADPNLSGARRLDQLAAQAGARRESLMDPLSAFQLGAMLRAVVTQGTAGAARRLPMAVAGKTGTTNDNTDAWFVGYDSRLVGAVWLGHDDPSRKLGRGQDGSHAALPLWMKLMRLMDGERELAELPGEPPEELRSARIDPDSGLLAAPGSRSGQLLYFRPANLPTEQAGRRPAFGGSGSRRSHEF